MDTPFSFEIRSQQLEAMAAETVDLLILGGGITGAGIARDAAMRGLRTALVDKGDFAWGTSSRTCRLIHGGLHDLELRHWRRVFEASRERRVLLRIAPHLVRQQSFLFPIHEGGRVTRLKLFAWMWLYDLLALFRNVRQHRWLSKPEVLRAEPGLRIRGLKGGARYGDAVCDDARLTLATVRDAHRRGALVANYALAERLEMAEGRVRGARVVDLTTGVAHTVRAKVVVNATGPWSDEIRSSLGGRGLLQLTKGVHLLIPRTRVGNHDAVTFATPIDGRLLFIIPQGELTYIGTTETDETAQPDDVRPGIDDIIYLLRSVNAVFPGARLTPDDVRTAWAGLLPGRASFGSSQDSGADDAAIMESHPGLITVIGTSLTMYRSLAARAVDHIAKVLRELDGREAPAPAGTDRHPLPGGEIRDPDLLVDVVVREGMARRVAEHLVGAHGGEAPAIVRMALENPDLGHPVVRGQPVLRAEIYHAIRREMAVTLADLMMRRTRLFYEAPDHAVAVAAEVAAIAAGEMGWDSERTESELAAYRQEVARVNAFRSDPTDRD